MKTSQKFQNFEQMIRKRITYRMTEDRYLYNGEMRTAYGIAIETGTETDIAMDDISSVEDITADRQRLAELVRLCNLMQLSPIHLEEVIMDFLAD